MIYADGGNIGIWYDSISGDVTVSEDCQGSIATDGRNIYYVSGEYVWGEGYTNISLVRYSLEDEENTVLLPLEEPGESYSVIGCNGRYLYIAYTLVSDNYDRQNLINVVDLNSLNMTEVGEKADKLIAVGDNVLVWGWGESADGGNLYILQPDGTLRSEIDGITDVSDGLRDKEGFDGYVYYMAQQTPYAPVYTDTGERGNYYRLCRCDYNGNNIEVITDWLEEDLMNHLSPEAWEQIEEWEMSNAHDSEIETEAAEEETAAPGTVTGQDAADEINGLLSALSDGSATGIGWEYENTASTQGTSEKVYDHSTDYYTASDDWPASFTDQQSGITITFEEFTDQNGMENGFEEWGSGSAGTLDYILGFTEFHIDDDMDLIASPGVDEGLRDYYDNVREYQIGTYGYIGQGLSEDEQVSNYLLLHNTQPSAIHGYMMTGDGYVTAPAMTADNGMRGDTQTETINGRQATWFLETWGPDAGSAGGVTTEIWVYFFSIDINGTDSAYIIAEGFSGWIYEDEAKAVAGAYTFS